jgi:hypothetical protein
MHGQGVLAVLIIAGSALLVWGVTRIALEAYFLWMDRKGRK